MPKYVQPYGRGTEVTPGSSVFRTGGRRSIRSTTSIVNSGTISAAGVYLVSAATGSTLVTLPSASAIGVGGVIQVIRTDSVTANTVTIVGIGGNAINGASSATLTRPYNGIELVSDGSNWYSGYPRLDDIADVALSGLATNNILYYNGTNWSNLTTTGDWLTQYVLLAGRATGQTIIGGTASGDDLTLRSTSHATLGDIILGSPAMIQIAEATSAVGFFGATPIARPGTFTITNSPAVATALNVTTNTYTGIDNAQPATPYAQVTDLNSVNTKVENVAAVLRQLVRFLGDTAGLGLVNETSY